jgi:hypothetical protein
MAIPTKGVNNIRTLSGRADQVSLPYRIYMQVTCLEMERTRRDKERQSASQRIMEIDARLKEIDQAKQELLQAVSTKGKGLPARLPGLELKPTIRRGASGFKIRY